MRYVVKYLLLIIALVLQNFAQTHMIKSTGELIDLKTNYGLSDDQRKNNQIAGILDTLSYQPNGDFDVELGIGVQDVLVQWFLAPAEMIIKALGYRCSQAGNPVFFRLIKLDWSESEARQISHPQYIGYYPSEEDGYNNAGAFVYEATGEWIDKTNGEYSEPFDREDWVIWEDDSFGWPILPEAKDISDLSYEFFETSIIGYEPGVHQGDIIGVVISNTFGNDTTKFWSREKNTEYWYEIPGWKYYEYGKETPEEPGWWATDFVFDFSLVVEFVSEPRVRIYNLTRLLTTTSTNSREVCCFVTSENPSGGPSGVEKVELIYSVNDEPGKSIEMTHLGDGYYCGEIPGQEPGDEITYYVSAIDINGYSAISNTITYKIFDPNPNADLLIVMNNFLEWRAEQLIPYYLKYYNRDFDKWYYNEIPDDLLQHYSKLIEISSTQYTPAYNNRDVISEWLDKGDKNYMKIDQDALGRWNNFTDSTFTPGDFEYDYLGVQQSFNNVSANPDSIPNTKAPSFVQFIANTILGDSAAGMFQDSVWYNPHETYGGDYYNTMDQFIPREDLAGEVFLNGYDWSMAIARPAAHNFIDNKNNKIVFMAIDPLSLHSDSSWIGVSSVSPFTQALKWFGISVDVNKEEHTPTQFSLSQNYPNPFNPTTTIKFTIPSVETPYRASLQTKLIVYDILGREVKTLINKQLQPGEYEVQFDGSNLPSGVYFYRLTSGEFSQARKMLLLK